MQFEGHVEPLPNDRRTQPSVATLLTIVALALLTIILAALTYCGRADQTAGFESLYLQIIGVPTALASVVAGFILGVRTFARATSRSVAVVSLAIPTIAAMAVFAAVRWPTGRTLIEAIWANDVDSVRWALKCGVDPNTHERQGFDNHPGPSALCAAASNGHVAIVRLLLQEGAQLQGRDRHCYPLTEAIASGHEAVAKLLIDAGADLNHVSQDGRSPFMAAVLASNFPLADFLVSRGADPDRAAPQAYRAVGEVERLKYLASHGVDLETENSLVQRTPLMFAAERGYA